MRTLIYARRRGRLPVMRFAFLLFACIGCGSGRTCSEAFGQDCGPDVEVTLRYLTFQQFADAGPVPGAADGGTASNVGCDAPGAVCRCSICEVRATMPLAQYRYAVARQTCNGTTRETSERSFLLDCTTPGCGHQSDIFGVSNSFCEWSPALLRP